MRVQHKVACVAVLGLVVVLGASACGSASPDSHLGHGVVKGLDPGARQITLDHEDIPGFMKAMTMTFSVASDVALDEIDPGAEVDFRVREDSGVYTVTEIRRSDS